VKTFADISVSQMPEMNTLTEKITDLGKQYCEARSFILGLSRGRLDLSPPRFNRFADPYKQLHSELCHLVWQITQISDGDYDQKVSFSGDFSDAMNRMIAGLRERKELADKLLVSEKQLREYADELKRLNATKDKLFSIIAHDLRNPFNALVNISEMLTTELEAGNNEETVEFARMINSAAIQGYQLLLNLLDWSRQQGGNIVYKPRLFDMNNIINDNISLVALSAASKGITVEFVDKEKHVLNSDDAIFSTVFRNLLSNAIKYSYEGGHVFVETDKVGEIYTISVKDSGAGIPADRLDSLFSGDSVISTPGTNSEAGTGLGLMLCSDFVRLLGGEIWVKSVIGEGSVFTFSVPEKI
jgi:signal transduction histidine kinase